MQPLVYESDQWVRMKEAPDRVLVDPSTIYKWIKSGKVRTIRPMKELWLFLPDLLDAENAALRRGA